MISVLLSAAQKKLYEPHRLYYCDIFLGGRIVILKKKRDGSSKTRKILEHDFLCWDSVDLKKSMKIWKYRHPNPPFLCKITVQDSMVPYGATIVKHNFNSFRLWIWAAKTTSIGNGILRTDNVSKLLVTVLHRKVQSQRRDRRLIIEN